MKFIFSILAIIFLCSSTTTFAQEQPKSWTLEACIAYAIENNISVKQSELDIDNAEISKSEAIGNYLPSLNANANNSWNSGLTQNVTTGVLENQVTRNFSLSSTIGFNIFNGLSNLRQLQRAKLERLSAQYSLNQIKDNISLNVANAYLQILVSKQQLEVLLEQNAVTLEQVEQTKLSVEAGTLPEGDLYEIQATNANEQQQIQIARNDVKIARISLAQLLLLDDYKNFDIADEDYEIPITDILSKSPEEIIKQAEEERFEIKLAQQDLAIAEKDIEIARSQYYPTLSGFINYNTRESDRKRSVSTGIDPNNPTQQIGVVEGTNQAVVQPNFAFESIAARDFIDQLWRNDGLSYGIQLNVPIFNGFQTRNNVERRKVNAKRAEFQLEQTKLDLESNVYQAYVDAQGAAKSFEAAQKSVDAQRIAYDYAKERYDVGMSNAFDLSQSKFRLTNAENNLINAKYDYIFRLKVLELYFGIRVVEYN